MKRSILTLLFCLAASPVLAAVTFDAVTTGTSGGGGDTFIALTHTVGGACANPVLIASATWKANPPITISSVTATAGAMTVVGTLTMAGDGLHSVSMYYRAGATGSQTVTFNFTGGTVDVGTLAVRSYCGAHQSTTIGTPATATGGFDATNPSVNVTSATGELVVDVVDLWGDSTATLTVGGGGQTQRDNFFESRDSHVRADSDKAGTGTTTMTWTKNVNNTWAMVGVSLKPVVSGAVKHRSAIVIQ